MNPKVISLFSGCGGLDLGFIKAGFEVIFANDIDKEACESYAKNIGTHIVCKDIYTLNADEIPNGDILIGGFPCLGFTIANGKNRDLNSRANLKGKATKIFFGGKCRWDSKWQRIQREFLPKDFASL